MSQQETGTPQQIVAVIGEIAARGEMPTVEGVHAAIADAPLGLIHQELQSWRSRLTDDRTDDSDRSAAAHGSESGAVVEVGLAGGPRTPEALVAAVDQLYVTMTSEIAAAEDRARATTTEAVEAAERESEALRREMERALAEADARVRTAEGEAAAIAADNRHLVSENQRLKATVAEMETAKELASGEHEALMREREALQAERDAMAAALEEREQVTADAATAQQMAQDMPILEARVAALEAERDRLRNERNAARQAAIHAKGERDALKAVMGTAKFQRVPMRRR